MICDDDIIGMTMTKSSSSRDVDIVHDVVGGAVGGGPCGGDVTWGHARDRGGLAVGFSGVRGRPLHILARIQHDTGSRYWVSRMLIALLNTRSSARRETREVEICEEEELGLKRPREREK